MPPSETPRPDRGTWPALLLLGATAAFGWWFLRGPFRVLTAAAAVLGLLGLARSHRARRL